MTADQNGEDDSVISEHVITSKPEKSNQKGPKKLPLASPKKINFGAAKDPNGPPKPPRNFDYSSLADDKAAPRKERKLKSPREMLSKSKKDKTVGELNGEVNQLKSCDRDESVEREENMYVTLPSRQEDNSSPSKKSATPSPPPLPSSLPPSASKPKQTMYENVWIERNVPVIHRPENTVPDKPGFERWEVDNPPTVPPRSEKPNKERTGNSDTQEDPKGEDLYYEAGKKLQYSEFIKIYFRDGTEICVFKVCSTRSPTQ